jgi:hypothetical protein
LAYGAPGTLLVSASADRIDFPLRAFHLAQAMKAVGPKEEVVVVAMERVDVEPRDPVELRLHNLVKDVGECLARPTTSLLGHDGLLPGPAAVQLVKSAGRDASLGEARHPAGRHVHQCFALLGQRALEELHMPNGFPL